MSSPREQDRRRRCLQRMCRNMRVQDRHSRMWRTGSGSEVSPIPYPNNIVPVLTWLQLVTGGLDRWRCYSATATGSAWSRPSCLYHPIGLNSPTGQSTTWK